MSCIVETVNEQNIAYLQIRCGKLKVDVYPNDLAKDAATIAFFRRNRMICEQCEAKALDTLATLCGHPASQESGRGDGPAVKPAPDGLGK